MALALYRKYRSATFAEVIGQEHVTAPLMQALSAGRINHAYLFSGPRGCGKTSSARILARSLNCERGPTPTPCGECGSCKDLAPNGPGSIDVIEIDAASHGGVEDARELRERAYYAPVRDHYKVYIIDEAHMVTPQGFNALLKLVEEPPEFLIFIFATTEPDKVLQTIRSRTHHYPFRLIPPSILRAHLERICHAERVTVEPTVFPLVVRAGGGSARDCLSILDQLLAGAGPDGVGYSMAVGLLGVTDSALLEDMTDSLAVGDAAGVYATIDRVVEAGHDPRRFAADLLERFRDLIVLESVPDAVDKGLIDYPADQAERMAAQSRRLGIASLVRFAEIAHTTLTDMRGTTSPRLMLELLCSRMLLPDAASDSAALLQRLERLERRQGMGVSSEPHQDDRVRPARPAPVETPGSASRQPIQPPAEPELAATEPPRSEPEPAAARAPAPATAPEPTTEPTVATAAAPATEPTVARGAAPATEPTVAPGGVDSAGFRRVWPDVLQQVKARSRRTRALLDNAAVATVEGTLIRLSTTSAPIAKMITDESNLSVLREALGVVVGGGWQIEISAEGTAAPQLEEPPSDPEPQGSRRPTSDRPASDRPASDRPASDRPAGNRPASDRPAGNRPAGNRPASDGVDEDADAAEGSERGADPEAAAIALLQSSLGARSLEG